MQILLVAILCSGLVFVSCKGDKRNEPFTTGMEGKSLPEFSIQLLDSVSWLNFKDISAGKRLIIFYYSPLCPYCRAQMRDMVNNMESLKEEQMYVLTNADLPSIEQFANYFDLNSYPNVVVGRDTGSVILQKYRLMSVPFTAYFDENKKLKVAYVGRLTSHSLLNIK